MDGTRLSDGAFIVFKIVRRSEYPYEVDIAKFFSTEPLRSDPKNHCVPIYDILSLPGDVDTVIMVMPLLLGYTAPPFRTVGEAVDCFRQLFEVGVVKFLPYCFNGYTRVFNLCTSIESPTGIQIKCVFLVLRFERDCKSLNIMMDANRLYVDAFHPVHPLMRRDFSGFARYKTRTQRPVRYFLIDFGLSRSYDSKFHHQALRTSYMGGDKEVPEFQNSSQPCDLFPTDVFYIGNVIRKDFIEVSFRLVICSRV